MTTESTSNLGPVEGRKDTLVKDLKVVASDTAELLKEVPASAAGGIAAARAKVEARLAAGRSRLAGARVRVAAKAQDAAVATDAYAHNNPWKVLGLGVAAAGIIVGLLVGRRRHTH